MKAKLEIYFDNEDICKRIYQSLNPDIKKERESLTQENNKLIYEIEDKNFSHILAACNSILKLINEALKLESKEK